MARKVLPAARPFLFLCTENWNSLKSIAKIRPSTHVLLLSGLRDDLVPPQHMKELYKAVELQGAEKQTRQWVDFEYGTHSMSRLLYIVKIGRGRSYILMS